MKLLLDQGLPRSAAVLLRERGADVIHVGDIGMGAASDRDILQYALKNGLTVVTLDADFHAMLMTSGATVPSVIRLRLEGLKGEMLAVILETVGTTVAEDLEHGALVTVTRKSIRVHRLKQMILQMNRLW